MPKDEVAICAHASGVRISDGDLCAFNPLTPTIYFSYIV